jgi:hypothetical protein
MNKKKFIKILQMFSALNFMGLRNAFITTKLGTAFKKNNLNKLQNSICKIPLNMWALQRR